MPRPQQQVLLGRQVNLRVAVKCVIAGYVLPLSNSKRRVEDCQMRAPSITPAGSAQPLRPVHACVLAIVNQRHFDWNAWPGMRLETHITSAPPGRTIQVSRDCKPRCQRIHYVCAANSVCMTSPRHTWQEAGAAGQRLYSGRRGASTQAARSGSRGLRDCCCGGCRQHSRHSSVRPVLHI